MDNQKIKELTRKVAQLLAENHATKLDVDKIFMCLDGYMAVSYHGEQEGG